MKNKIIIAIDPGSNGGICWTDRDNRAYAVKMPQTPRDILDQIREIVTTFAEGDPSNCVCYLEDVGHGRSGESMSALCKFARHNGNLEGFLISEDIPIVTVLPQKWQKSLSIGKSSDCPNKTAWKNKIKAKVQNTFPHIKVTLCTADALGILIYGMVND